MIDTGDTAFMLLCSALVMFMTPGLALFYGGMVRSKNALGTIMQSFICLCLITLVWVLWGYSLAFGPDVKGIVGNLSLFGLNGVGAKPLEGSTIPQSVFMVFQLMFAIITPALISGAVAERMKFGAFCLFVVLWSTFIYSPLAHWVWGGGWMAKLGALDFAGGTVVHISSGISAMAAIMILKKRKGYPKEPIMPHNLPMTITGAALLWFGWYGFNAGSALACNGLAANAFVVTHIASAAAALAWGFAEKIHGGRATTLGVASGAVAGLVAITPASGFVGPMSAILIGFGGGFFCYLGVMVKARIKYDDSLDVIGIHGVGGTWGALATGLFASTEINPAGANGLFFGNPYQLWIQFISVLGTMIFAFVGTLIIFKVVDLIMGVRVTDLDEVKGLGRFAEPSPSELRPSAPPRGLRQVFLCNMEGKGEKDRSHSQTV